MFEDDEREDLPSEAREIHQRLVSDSAYWARRIPSHADKRITEFARTAPQRVPLPVTQHTRNVHTQRRPNSTLPDIMTSKGQTNMLKNQGSRRALFGGIAAVAVVALLVGVLYTMYTAHGTSSGLGSGPSTPTVVAATPTLQPQIDASATPGPLAQYIAKLYTTTTAPTEGSPVTVVSRFKVGDAIFVSLIAHGLPKGTHTISIQWYSDGSVIELPPIARTSQTINSDQRVTFVLAYPSAGVGMAKVYIDRPASDTGASPSDPYLAGTVIFAIEAR